MFYVDMDSIQADLLDGVNASKLACPESEITTGSIAHSVNNETLSFECWDKSCVLIEEMFHLRSQGGGFLLRASGIAFCGATKESVVLRFDTDSARNFLLKDCLWVEKSGSRVFRVDHAIGKGSSPQSIDCF